MRILCGSAANALEALQIPIIKERARTVFFIGYP